MWSSGYWEWDCLENKEKATQPESQKAGQHRRTFVEVERATAGGQHDTTTFSVSHVLQEIEVLRFAQNDVLPRVRGGSEGSLMKRLSAFDLL